jgi:hypothetical protein
MTIVTQGRQVAGDRTLSHPIPGRAADAGVAPLAGRPAEWLNAPADADQ